MTAAGSASSIWESICQEGLVMYESRSEQARTSFLITIGSSGSVILPECEKYLPLQYCLFLLG